jgi:hypothetical protein
MSEIKRYNCYGRAEESKEGELCFYEDIKQLEKELRKAMDFADDKIKLCMRLTEQNNKLQDENAELREAICIHVRECMDTGGIDNDQDAVIAFKNTFSEENYRS